MVIAFTKLNRTQKKKCASFNTQMNNLWENQRKVSSRQGSIVAWARKSLCSGAEKDHALTCKYQAVGTLHNQHTHFVMRNKIATRTCVSWTWQSVEYIGPFPLFLRPFRGLIKLLIIPAVNKYFFRIVRFFLGKYQLQFLKMLLFLFLKYPNYVDFPLPLYSLGNPSKTT